VRTSTTSRLASLLAAPLLVAIVVQNLTNFAFHAFVGRLLSPDQYGALGAVLAVMVLLSVPLSAVQAAASGLVAEHGWDSASVRSVLRSGLLVSLAVGAVVLALSGVVRDFYRLGSAVDAVVLAPFVVVSIVLALLRGLLLGDGQVRATAASYLVGASGRLVLGASLALLWGVTGALVGTLLGEMLATAAAARRVLRRNGSSVTATSLGWRRVLLSCAAVTGLFLFSTIDLLLARHFLFDDASGTYTAAATVAKTVLALPAAATSVYFPRLVLAWRSRDVTVLRTAVIVVCGLALLGAVVVAALPGLVLTLLYGAGNYEGGADLVRLLALVAGATSLVSVLTYAGLARKAWTIVVPAVGASLEIALIWMRHGSAEEIARMSLAALVPTLVVMATWECAAWVRRGASGRYEAR
jgi:O-antigen/teichoic acid export membrane protein